MRVNKSWWRRVVKFGAMIYVLAIAICIYFPVIFNSKKSKAMIYRNILDLR
jgi:hypothetical protein